MITSIETTPYTTENTLISDTSTPDLALNPSSAKAQLATELEPASANLSKSPSTSSLSDAVANLQKLIQNLIEIIQGLFRANSSQSDSRTPTQISNTLTPAEEPPIIVPLPKYSGDEDTTVTLASAGPTLSTEDKSTSPTTKTTKPKTTKKNKPASTKKTSTKTDSTRATKKVKTKNKSPSKTVAMKSTIVGNGEFLWKPRSDKDGKLAVLLPKRYTGTVQSLEVISSKDGSTLAKGTPAGVGNGDREHFRFTRSGDSFPDGSIVLVSLRDGSTIYTQISDTAQRFSL